METVSENTIPSLRDESDDEEEMERHAFRVEEDVAAFINEPPIRHNIYPDTENDSDTDEEEDGEEQQMKRQRTRERYRIRRGDGNLFEGQVFFNGVAFKEAVLDYALKTGHNIKQYRYDKTKLGFSCVGRNVDSHCLWRVIARVKENQRDGMLKCTRMNTAVFQMENVRCLRSL